MSDAAIDVVPDAAQFQSIPLDRRAHEVIKPSRSGRAGTSQGQGQPAGADTVHVILASGC